MTAATSTVEVRNLVFSRWIEVKHKAEPHNYIEFFLVTDTGNEVLAISAEDHGNSHYVYQSTGAFAKYGTLNSKNRADTISWLEMIIKDSQIKVDSQLAAEVAHAGEPTPDNPLGLYYTQHRVEKTANPDGTHTQRFFLLDQYGIWHLAVVGEERETRDGHYLYKATEEFSLRYPLSCHAQKDVIHWLEQRVTHNLGSAAAKRKHEGSGSVNTSAGAGGPAVSGPGTGPQSGVSVDAWGQACPSLGAGGGHPTAATPTSAFDGPAGSDGSSLIPYTNHQPTSPLQQQQVSVFTGSPAAVGATDGSVPGLHHPKQLQQQTPITAFHKMQADGAAQGAVIHAPAAGTATATQQIVGMPPLSPLASSPVSNSQQQLSNHIGALTMTDGQVPSVTLPLLQHQHQQLSNSGIQHPTAGSYHQSQQQQQNYRQQQRVPGEHPGHSAPAVQASGSSLPLPSQQQQQQQQRQQEGAPGCQPVLPAESQGLAQLLAGLAASMPGGGATSQLPSNGPPLQLQLPLPPQLQLQGSNMPPPMTTPLQQQQQASPQLQPLQQFMVPSLFQQQQQQTQGQLPFPGLDTQLQLQQQQQHLLQQLQQRQQELQQLLQGNTAVLALTNAAPAQQLLGSSVQLPSPVLKSLPGLSAGIQAWNSCSSIGVAAGSGGMQQQLSEQPATLPSSAQAGLGSAAAQAAVSSQDFGSRSAPGTGGLDALGPAATMLGSPFCQLAANTIPLCGSALAVGGSGTGAGGTLGHTTLASGCTGTAATASGMQALDQQPQQQLLGQAGGVVGMPGGPSNTVGTSGTAGGAYGSSGGTHGSGGGAHGSGGGAYGSGDGAYGSFDAPGNGSVSFAAALVTPPGGGMNPVGLGSAAPQPPSAIGLPATLGPGGVSGDMPTGAVALSGPFPQPFATAPGQLTAPGSLLPGARSSKEAALGSAPGSGHHHGSRGGGRGSSGKHKLAGVAEVAHKRKLARLAAAGEEAVRLAQGAYLAALRHQALSEAAQQEALRKTIASWVRGQISDDEVSVNGWHENLEQMLGEVNRTRTVSVPFLSNECLLEITRGSVEAITLAAAVSLTAPYDPTAAPYIPPQPPPPLLPAPPPAGAAVVGMTAAPASASTAKGSGEGSSAVAAGAGPTDGTQPSATVLCNAEAMAAVSSLKALLMGDLQAAVLGPAGHASTPQSTHESQQAPTASVADEIGRSGPADGTVMDVDSTSAGPVQIVANAVAEVPGQQPSSPVRGPNGPAGLTTCVTSDNMASAPPSSNTVPGLQSTAAAAGPHNVSARAPSPAAGSTPHIVAPPMAEGTGSGLHPPQVQVPLASSGAPGASPLTLLPLPSPQSVQVPPPQQQMPLPLSMMRTKSTGPVGAIAVQACAGTAKSWSFSDPHMSKHGVRIALESLRELAALCPPVANMASSNLVDTVKKFEEHPHPSVSGLAKAILKRWRGSFIHRLRCMSDSRCYQDPVAALESKIQANEIVFPSPNELLGVPRGHPAGAATGGEGTATPIAAATATVPAAASPYTPMAGTSAGAGVGLNVGGNPPYSLATTPATMMTGEVHSLASLPVTPPLSFATAGTPILSAAATAATVGIATPGGIAAPGSVTTTVVAETSQGLFNVPLTSASNPIATPQLFNRHNGATAGPPLPSPGLTGHEMPTPSLQSSAPPSAPMPPPAPALTTPKEPGGAMTPHCAAPAQTTNKRARAEIALLMGAAPSPLPPSPPSRQPRRSTSGPNSAAIPSPRRQPPLPPAASLANAATAVTAVPQLEALPLQEAGRGAATPAATPAALQAPAAVAAPLMPSAQAPLSSPSLAVAPQLPGGHRVPPRSLPPSSSSATTVSHSIGLIVPPTFVSPSHLLSASSLFPEATTADVAALLATSAQSLAAHLQNNLAAAADGGGAGSNAPPSISQAQLTQLVTLASTAQVYASALRTSDAAGAASAWQSLVHQLRQAQSLTLGHGRCVLGGVLPQRPVLLMPSPSLGTTAAVPPQSSHPVQPLQTQPLQVASMTQAHGPAAVIGAGAKGKMAGEQFYTSQAGALQPSPPAAGAAGSDARGAADVTNGTALLGSEGAVSLAGPGAPVGGATEPSISGT